MNKKVYSLVMLSMMIALVSIFTSCASSPGWGLTATNRTSQVLPAKSMSLVASPAYTVVGPVTLEKRWMGVMGFSFLPNKLDLYIWQSGGVTYSDLFEEAKKLYGNEVDAVVDINTGFSGSHYVLFYAQRKHIVTGIAIKYTRDEVNVQGEKTQNIVMN